ncbi:NHL repeat-containing protein [Stieleria varia]|uniref:NHL repeat protein n=1 Tax=Stieleria varia TaxID=2528005 RepID=A0A5C6ARF1_9BACT|nr:hypothetical protein [Stieleria varia]TWU02138.1 NHL repeat protein [Stieleria varia]
MNRIRFIAAISLCIPFVIAGIHPGIAQDSATAQDGYRVWAGTGESPLALPEKDPVHEALPPTSTPLGNPFGIECLSPDTVYLTTIDDHSVWRWQESDNVLHRVAGNGKQGYSGDGGPATMATFNWPHEVRLDKNGDLYIADTRNHVIRVIDAETGIIRTIAGDGQPGFQGDGKSGDAVRFSQPHSVVLDGTGGALVADTINHRVRRIDLATGIVTTFAGTGKPALPTNGAVASETPLFGPRSLAVDDQYIWVVLREGNSVWRIDRETSKIEHVAGTGQKGHTGDGGPPLHATFRGPKGIAIDGQGHVLVVDTENHVVRRIDLTANTIETVGTSSKSNMKRPHGIAPFGAEAFLVGDSEMHRVLLGR